MLIVLQGKLIKSCLNGRYYRISKIEKRQKSILLSFHFFQANSKINKINANYSKLKLDIYITMMSLHDISLKLCPPLNFQSVFLFFSHMQLLQVCFGLTDIANNLVTNYEKLSQHNKIPLLTHRMCLLITFFATTTKTS